MIGGSDKPQALRAAVVFTRDASLAHQVREACRCAPSCSVVHVTSGYEAAAELLTQSAAVLVVDLACLTPPHMSLLQVARRRGATMVGVGSLPGPANAESLSGLRLIARNDLPQALAALVAPPAKSAMQTPDEESASLPEAKETIRPERPAAPPSAIGRAESEQAAGVSTKTPAQEPLPTAPQPHKPGDAATPARDQAPPMLHQERLLTSEEIAALLENGT